MGNLLADALRSIGPERSPLLADFTPEDRNWWRFLLGFLCAVAVGVLFSLVLGVIVMVVAMVVLAGQGIDIMEMQSLVERFVAGEFEPTWAGTLATFGGLGLLNAAMMASAVWIATVLVKKPIRLSFTTARKWRWRQLFGGLIIYGIASVLILLFDLAISDEELDMPMVALSPTVLHMAIYAVLMTVFAVIAAGAEELVFRGWLLRHTANLLRNPAVYIVFNGVLFSAIHLDFDPNSFLARTILGMGFCWMALRFGGIEFATGAHAANNILILLFIEPLVLTPPPPEAFSPLAGLEIALILALMVASTEIAIRVPWIAKLIGPPGEGQKPTQEAFT